MLHRSVILFTLFLSCSLIIMSQETDPMVIHQDSLHAVSLLEQGREFYNRNELDSSIDILEQSIQIAVETDFRLVEAENYYLLALIFDSVDDWELTLRYFLKAVFIFSEEGLFYREALIYSLIAEKYNSFKVYDKAAQYSLNEFDIYPEYDLQPKLDASLNAALAWFLNNDYERSMQWYDTSYANASILKDTLLLVESLYGISGSHMKKGEYDETRAPIDELITLQRGYGDQEGIAETYNTLALLDFRQKKYDEAITNYQITADYIIRSGGSAETAYSNIAICYQNIGNPRMTNFYFEKALEEARRSGHRAEQARLELTLAVLSFNQGDLYHADYYCERCLESARISGNWDVIKDVYKVYSDVKEAGNDFVKALEYYERHLSIRDSLLLEQRIADQEQERLRKELETYEQQLRLALADEEIKDLALQNLRVEAEKRENDLRLIESERELERSERDRLENFLALERERTNRILQQIEIDSLENATTMQRLELIQREVQERELIRQNEKLESEAVQQQLELEKEQEIRKRAIWTLASLAVIVVLIFLSLLSVRRKNQVLAAQKKEIEVINADLEIKNEEVSFQNTQILLQKEIIEEKNLSITDSIEYASRIQNAVLPPVNFLTDWGLENFIMFRPKDIVSGDFYWGARADDLLCFASADCTGHGVPGAFMSMLGTAYLNEIVNTQDFKDASGILNMLRNEVINSLKQRGIEGETQDGMDISMCVLDESKQIMHYAGANNPLYLIRNGKLQRFNADKMPIGIHRSSDKSFTNHLLKPRSGDLIYIFSDGYADQFGGEHGKKFKYKAFREMLLEIHEESLEKQLGIIEKRFDDWKGDNEQVDDVLVIGIRVNSQVGK